MNEELDRCRSLLQDSKQHIVGLEARERDASGIPSLKVGYNRVFGYYLEVKKSNQAAIPSHYVRKQTLSNAERYITPEIKELEEEILGAEGRMEEARARRIRTHPCCDRCRRVGIAENLRPLSASSMRWLRWPKSLRATATVVLGCSRLGRAS